MTEESSPLPDPNSNQSQSIDKTAKSKRKKIASLVACALWVLSIGLSFAIPPSSNMIWIPDAVLLAGFFPLLWICPYSFVWIIWGILTAFIGAFLLLLTNIPDNALPPDTHTIKHHLAEYHPYWSWMILGLVGTIAGVVKLVINLSKMILDKRSKA